MRLITLIWQSTRNQRSAIEADGNVTLTRRFPSQHPRSNSTGVATADSSSETDGGCTSSSEGSVDDITTSRTANALNTKARETNLLRLHSFRDLHYHHLFHTHLIVLQRPESPRQRSPRQTFRFVDRGSCVTLCVVDNVNHSPKFQALPALAPQVRFAI